MANKKNNDIIEKHKFEIIEKNEKLLEILFYIFGGQVLEIDLREFCVKLGLYKTDAQFNRAVKNLKTAKVIRFEKLVRTSNNIIIATPCVFRFLGHKSKTIQVKVETVTRNSYTNYVLINSVKPNLEDDIQSISNKLKDESTFLSSKRDVEACYKVFNTNLTSLGAEAKLEALHREDKRKTKLKNHEKSELKKIEYMHKETLQTLRESDIFIMRVNDKYKVYITDNNSNYQLSNLSKKIATTIRILSEHTQIQSSIYINVLVKDNYSKKKLDENFIMLYQNLKTEANEVALTQSVNKKIKKYNANLAIKYELSGVTEKKVYALNNTYKNEPDVINVVNIKVVGTEIARRHNSDLRALALVEHQEERRRWSMEEEIERRVQEKLKREKIKRA